MINSILPALCLCIGFYFGFKIGTTKQLPNIKRDIKENKQKLEEEKELKQMNKILGNLDRYDGTTKGQEDIV